MTRYPCLERPLCVLCDAHTRAPARARAKSENSRRIVIPHAKPDVHVEAGRKKSSLRGPVCVRSSRGRRPWSTRGCGELRLSLYLSLSLSPFSFLLSPFSCVLSPVLPPSIILPPFSLSLSLAAERGRNPRDFLRFFTLYIARVEAGFSLSHLGLRGSQCEQVHR